MGSCRAIVFCLERPVTLFLCQRIAYRRDAERTEMRRASLRSSAYSASLRLKGFLKCDCQWGCIRPVCRPFPLLYNAGNYPASFPAAILPEGADPKAVFRGACHGPGNRRHAPVRITFRQASADDYGWPRNGTPLLPGHCHPAPPDRVHHRGGRYRGLRLHQRFPAGIAGLEANPRGHRLRYAGAYLPPPALRGVQGPAGTVAARTPAPGLAGSRN